MEYINSFQAQQTKMEDEKKLNAKSVSGDSKIEETINRKKEILCVGDFDLFESKYLQNKRKYRQFSCLKTTHPERLKFLAILKLYEIFAFWCLGK